MAHLQQPCRLVVVGDVHDQWSERDVACLRSLQPSMVLFVGDFGNEAVQLVAEVARLDMPKAVILGNHDAWYTMTPRPRKRPWAPGQLDAVLGPLPPPPPPPAPAAQSAPAAPAPGGQQQSVAGLQPGLRSLPAEGTAPGAEFGSSVDSDDDPGREPDSSSEAGPRGASHAPGASGAVHALLPRALFAGVDAQLRLLGGCHVGFSSLPVPGHVVSVLGGRPFSKGGGLDAVAPFYNQLYGLSTCEQYTERVVQEGLRAAAGQQHQQQQQGQQQRQQGQQQGQQQRQQQGQQGGQQRGQQQQQALVVLAHNGPSGLGDKAHHMCGVDWRAGGGDHGDQDLRHAIEQLQQAGAKLPLVCFGHMHHTLCGGFGRRTMVHVDPASGTVYLNAATVPRVRKAPQSLSPGRRVGKQKQQRERRRQASGSEGRGGVAVGPTQHHFMVVEMSGGEVARARDVWVEARPADAGAGEESEAGSPSTSSSDGAGAATEIKAGVAATAAPGTAANPYAVRVVEEREVFRREAGELAATCTYFDAHAGRYVVVTVCGTNSPGRAPVLEGMTT